MHHRIRAVFVFALLLGVCVASQPAMAISPTTPETQPTLKCESQSYAVNYTIVTNLYNDNTDAIPEIIKPALQSNVSELQIKNANQKYYTIHTDDSMQVTKVELGESSNKDVIVKTNRDTACSLYTSSNPVKTFQTEYNNDNIDITAEGTVKSTALFIVDKVSSFLG